MPIIRVVALLCTLLLCTATTGLTAEPAADKAAIEAAYTLFASMNMQQTYQLTIKNILDLQMQQNPGLAPFRQVMLQFFEKHMGWETMKPELAKIYAEDFSAQELQELAQFYQTPLGKKAVTVLPKNAAKGAALGQKKVQDNIEELKQMIAAEQQRLQQEAAKKAPAAPQTAPQK